jgi:penicillin-binding protein 1C
VRSNCRSVAVWVGNLEGDSMLAVSGTSGAAPVWRDIMLALHRSTPSRSAPPPPGLESRTIRFADNIESPRREYFLRGTGQTVQSVAPAQSRRPRIANPVSGAIFALDPDIPLNRQRLGVAIRGSAEAHRLLLNKRDIGSADSNPQIAMSHGSHLLTLVDAAGKPIDQVRFTIR